MDIKNSNTEQEEHVAGNSGGGLFFWGVGGFIVYIL